MSEVKKLTKEDLKVGMLVTQEQLLNIYDTYVYLELTSDIELTGNILYITDKPEISKVNEIQEKFGYLACFYQSKDEIDGVFA